MFIGYSLIVPLDLAHLQTSLHHSLPLFFKCKHVSFCLCFFVFLHKFVLHFFIIPTNILHFLPSFFPISLFCPFLCFLFFSYSNCIAKSRFEINWDVTFLFIELFDTASFKTKFHPRRLSKNVSSVVVYESSSSSYKIIRGENVRLGIVEKVCAKSISVSL